MHHLTDILLGFGYLGITITLFFESGVFLFFLPGDTLLFSAGIYASQGKLSFFAVVLWAAIASILGAHAGYIIGKRSSKLTRVFFSEHQMQKTEKFFARFGTYAVLLNRFVPVVRTIAPLLAGASGMDKKRFDTNNILGAFLWVSGIMAVGYFLGEAFPIIEKYIPVILGAVVIASFVLLAVEYYKNRKRKNTV